MYLPKQTVNKGSLTLLCQTFLQEEGNAEGMRRNSEVKKLMLNVTIITLKIFI